MGEALCAAVCDSGMAEEAGSGTLDARADPTELRPASGSEGGWAFIVFSISSCEIAQSWVPELVTPLSFSEPQFSLLQNGLEEQSLGDS